MTRFDELVQLCLDDKASESDIEEMFRLYREGRGNVEGLKRAYDEIALRAVDYKIERQHEIVRDILAAGKQRRSSSRRIWYAAASLMIAATIFYLSYQGTGEQAVELAQSEETYSEDTRSVVGNDFIHLPDGTTVTLQLGAKLTYRKAFLQREVELTGQAFFDVAHDSARPFRVHTGKVVTTVLGTAFNIDAASGELVTVTVTRGKVSVGDDAHTYGTIQPNEQIAVNTVTNEFVKSQVDSQTAVQWKEDYFILDRVSIEEAVALIEKRFNVEVIVQNREMLPCVISAYFTNHENLEQIIENISTVRQAQYSISGDVINISGGKACN